MRRRSVATTRQYLACTVVAASLVWPSVASSQGDAVPSLRVGRITGEQRPTIDGRVDEAPWAAVTPHAEFVQQEPFDGVPAVTFGHYYGTGPRQHLRRAYGRPSICGEDVARSRRD